ncbi:MAG: protein phosphatase 2C domain-containing protein [bacterium]|nr:protein phosphatase 2C domain-containing protein [bacterium]
MFEIAFGSVRGRDHAQKNNQDAYCVYQDSGVLVGIVSDGCSSGHASEAGAHLGASLLTRELHSEIRDSCIQICAPRYVPKLLSERLGALKRNIINRFNVLGAGGSMSSFVNDYLLFTTVGVICTPGWSAFFSLGDGIVVINGEIIRLGPFPENAPPYLAYGLVETSLQESDPELLEFNLIRVMSSSDLQSFLIGTDGVTDLMDVEERKIPGKEDVVGPLSQFWKEDRYFKNSDMVRRRLAMISSESVRIDHDSEISRLKKEPGLLKDDTTLIVGRRRKGE